MSNGWARLVINNFERALSTDVNRAEKFIQQDVAELLRYMYDVTGNQDSDAGALATEPNTIETPLRAEIIAGLLVRPQAGTLNLSVDAGLGFFMAPDAASDESNYKYIHDDGVSGAGTLAMTANASGSTRIDVVECQIDAIEDIVTDNRDIFDPTTGLFTATSVTKERRGRLTYRVRAGTPGAGIPANQSGWLPLAVASVPNGTVAVDTVTFWDVRPLVNDRVFGTANLTTEADRNGLFLDVGCSSYAGSQTDLTLSGRVEALWNGRKVGGKLRSGSPVADADTIVVGSVTQTNLEPTTTFALGSYWYMYLLFPHGLPRWARYTASGTRVPRSPLGIPVVSATAPTTVGRPSAAITLPNSTGLGVTTTAGVCVLVGLGEGAGVPGTLSASGREIHFGSVLTISPTTTDTGKARYDMTPANSPPNAREIHVEAIGTCTAPGVSYRYNNSLISYVPGSTSVEVTKELLGQFTGTASENVSIFRRAWLGIKPMFPTLTGPSYNIDHQVTIAGGGSFGAATLTVKGLRL